MGRRSSVVALVIELGLLGWMATGTVVAQRNSGQTESINQRNRAVALTRSQSLVDLKTIQLGQGRTQVALNVQIAENTLNGMLIRHRSYDGALVGPTIRVRPGDTLEVHLANKLPKEIGPVAHGSGPG